MSPQAQPGKPPSWILTALVVAAVLGATACTPRARKQPPPGVAEWVLDRLPSSNPETQINVIAGTSPTDVWAVGWGFYHYDGAAWTNKTPADLSGYGTAMRAVSVVAKDDVWAVGVNGRVAHFDGKTWRGEQLDVARVSKTPDVKGYHDLIDVVAWPGEVWVTASASEYYRFDGKTWTAVSVPEVRPRTFQQIWGTSPKDVWSVGGRMDHFDGARWDTSTVLAAGLRKVHGSAANDVWAAGWKGDPRDDNGALFHFDGARWTDIALSAETPLLWSVRAHGKNVAYAVGQHGWALEWNGATWRPSPTGVKETLWDVYVTDGAAFAVGEIGPNVLRRVTAKASP